MKAVQVASAILLYMSRTIAILMMIIILYALAVVLFYQANHSTSLPIRVLSSGEFQIFYPFTQKPFLLGEYSAGYLFSNFITIILYSIFAWLLSSVFNAFRQTKLFTRKAVKQLMRFSLINLILPAVFIISLVAFNRELSDAFRITVLHFIIAMFAYFMAAIFKQGLELQEEQDLTF